ncbi:MAG TPA: hypothetical protein VEC57_14960 [Candidatus Limnocylindrales bacterium]|nr:hypothetical protein [Candidatus Limnocylindrales bacterium]
MPAPIILQRSTLGELLRALEDVRERLGDEVLVLTEVGFNGGRDLYVGSRTLTVYESFTGSSVTVSAIECREDAIAREERQAASLTAGARS